MIVDIYQVDAFSASLFQGNPAGVCISTSMLDEAIMLSIAEEMAVSETSFLALDTMFLRWATRPSSGRIQRKAAGFYQDLVKISATKKEAKRPLFQW
ncbi:hypothetical protein BZG14_02575 [Salinivibrio sp. IB282]|nr:hypothetical protein BZG14_02575 [Salinivibrio sp. IB282]